MSILLIVVVSLFTLYFILQLKIKKAYKYWESRNIPYKQPWSIFGNLGPVLSGKTTYDDLLEDVYREYSKHRVYGLYHFLKPVLVVNDMDLLKRICVKDFELFDTNTATEIQSIGGLDSAWNELFSHHSRDEWNVLRSNLSPIFSNMKMKAMMELMQLHIQGCLDYLQKDNAEIVTIETEDVFRKVSSDIFTSCFLGIECNSLEYPKNEVYTSLRHVADFSGLAKVKYILARSSPFLLKIINMIIPKKRVSIFTTETITEAIQSREQTGLIRPDIIHFFKEARKQKSQHNSTSSNLYQSNDVEKVAMTEDEMIYLNAGVCYLSTATSANLMTYLAHELALHPDVQKKLINEVNQTLKACNGKITYDMLMDMKYLNMIVSETLRLRARVLITRRCIKSVTIEPVLPEEKPLLIESGIEIKIPVVGIHKDPKYYPNPEKFDPERFSDENKRKIDPFTYLPFGTGLRNCIGSRFALVFAKLMIFSLLAQYEISLKKSEVSNDGNFLRHKHNYVLGLKRRSKA